MAWSSKGKRIKQLQVTLTENESAAVDTVVARIGATRSSWTRTVILRELAKFGFKDLDKPAEGKKAS